MYLRHVIFVAMRYFSKQIIIIMTDLSSVAWLKGGGGGGGGGEGAGGC